MSNEQARRREQGRRVKMARTGADLSRDQFAELVSELWEKVSREYVRRVEIGDKDPGLGFLLATAEITGWPVAWFTELEEAHNPRTVVEWFRRPIDANLASGTLVAA